MNVNKFIKDILDTEFSAFRWTLGVYRAEDKRGAILVNGGEKPSMFDDKTRYPYIQIYMGGVDEADTEKVANEIFKRLHMIQNEYHENTHIMQIEAMSDVVHLGRVENLYEFSINLKITMREV